jgi:hypothetical protein
VQELTRHWRTALHGGARLWVAILGCGLLGGLPVAAQPPLPDYQVKAAFLYHFTQFIEWPAEGSDVFLICVASSSATTTSLQQLTKGKFVSSLPIRIAEVGRPAEVRNCRILFIAFSARPRLQEYLAAAHNSSTLTVGEQSGFIDSGGMVEMYLADQHVGFRLNAEEIQRAHLLASSSLLRLARPPDEASAVKGYR